MDVVAALFDYPLTDLAVTMFDQPRYDYVLAMFLPAMLALSAFPCLLRRRAM